jgi:ATP-dependent helicase/nuclease subunit A
VAILLRKMTDLQEYVEALRAEGLPFVVEGQKTFFAAEEVTTFISLLAATVDPRDATALAAVLRSPLGSLTDHDLAVLARAGRLDYTGEAALPEDLADPEAVAALYAKLRRVHARAAQLPLTAALDLLLAELPLLESAAAAGGGEAAAGNIEKIRRIAAARGEDGAVGLREFARLLRESAVELQEEGENPLAEEGQDAIRILTVHKAKGLEFPAVILAGLHSGISPREEAVWIRREWTGGRFGLRLAGTVNPAGLQLADAEVARRDAEERRVFYVGATRAAEMLVLSAADYARGGGHRFLGYLREAVRLGGDAAVRIDPGELHCSFPEAPAGPAPSRRKPKRSIAARQLPALAELCRQRLTRAETAAAARLALRPSGLHGAEEDETAPEGALFMPLVGRLRDRAPLVGILAHAVLQHLDFARAEEESAARIEAVLTEHAAELGEERRELAAELDGLFTGFLKSKAFAELREAKSLAREIPFVSVRPEGGAPDGVLAAEGVIDLVCETDGRPLIVDYKTDAVTRKGAAERAERYRPQCAAYARAVAQALGRPVETARVVFLRPGVAVDMKI